MLLFRQINWINKSKIIISKTEFQPHASVTSQKNVYLENARFNIHIISCLFLFLFSFPLAKLSKKKIHKKNEENGRKRSIKALNCNQMSRINKIIFLLIDSNRQSLCFSPNYCLSPQPQFNTSINIKA